MLFRILQIAVPFVWFGMIAAISFLEAPLKFQAPNITIPLGLEIGRGDVNFPLNFTHALGIPMSNETFILCAGAVEPLVGLWILFGIFPREIILIA